MTMSTETVAQWRGAEMIDARGDKVGKIEEIYLDNQSGRPEWALVTTGMFGKKSTFVPLSGAKPADEGIRVTHEKSRIQDAPRIDADQDLSPQEERKLYDFYGVEYGSEGAAAGPEGPAVGEDVSGPETDSAMTRSEEELRVGKAKRERGRVRLRKYVVTDEVTQTVPVQREEVRVEREPITDATAGAATEGPEISGEEHEVTLHEEVPVVDKVAKPKERVRVDKETVTDEETVSGDVRKERIEVDDDRGGKR
jgi:uncharacterized protein (TIGR02271 family)